MIKSIKSFLLFNLFLSVTLVSILSIIGNLFLEHKGFQTHLDSQLTLAAYNIKVFFDKNVTPKELKEMQIKLNRISYYLTELNLDYDDELDDLNLLLKSIQFQVWDNNGKLLLHSLAAPDINLKRMTDGFHDIRQNNNSWRIFTLKVPSQNIYIVVLQRHLLRLELEKQITEDSIIIMLITYPFLAILIWVIVGRALSSLRCTTQAIKQRSPEKLDLISTESLPNEIVPLIDELNNLFDKLQETSLREKRFASDAAHELRTPLATLKTQIQVELNKKTNKAYEQALLQILKSIEKNTHVVNQLLLLSKIMPESPINKPEKLNLNKIAADILIELLPTADKKNISLSLNVTREHNYLNGNKTSLLILLRNLIDNAIRYSQKNSNVNIIITEKDQKIILDVADNGPGIPDELKQRVLSRFYRVIGTKTEGSGLGLSIVLQIIKLHKASFKLLDNRHGGLIARTIFCKNIKQIK